MNLEKFIILALIIIGGVWAFWLIFKRDLMQNQVGKLLSYFMGVIVTLLIVMAMVAWFLPWWATQLIENTNESTYVKELQEASSTLWNDLGDGDVVVGEPDPGINVTPSPTISPLSPQISQSQTSPTCGTRIYTVAPKDTLYSLSNRYGTTVEALMKCNDLPNNTIYIGQQLIVP